MRVLVTGASGFVGSHQVRVLRDRGDDVIAWGLGALVPGVTVVDMTDRAQVQSHDLRSVDTVIHLAGLAQVAGSFDRPAAYVCANASMQVNLMEALLKQRSTARVLVISTGAVYAGGSQLVTEESPIRAANPYVISKLTQEHLAAYYLERGLDVIIARPFNHTGPGQPRGYLVPDLASQLAALELSGGGQLHVGNLATSRDFTDVRDVAAAYVELLASGRRGHTYNVCSGATRSARELIEELLGLVGASIEVIEDPSLRRPTDTARVRASNAKLYADTGFKPSIPISVTLADTLDYWRQQLAGESGTD